MSFLCTTFISYLHTRTQTNDSSAETKMHTNKLFLKISGGTRENKNLNECRIVWATSQKRRCYGIYTRRRNKGGNRTYGYTPIRKCYQIRVIQNTARNVTSNLDYSRCPGTPQNIKVIPVVRAATRTVTQIALPTSNFLTYGSRIVSVRKGVDSDCPKKTRIGSSSY